jgi:hypothetical protein
MSSIRGESINILDDSTDDFIENFKLLKNNEQQSKLKLSNINTYLFSFNECPQQKLEQMQQKIRTKLL